MNPIKVIPALLALLAPRSDTSALARRMFAPPSHGAARTGLYFRRNQRQRRRDARRRGILVAQL